MGDGMSLSLDAPSDKFLTRADLVAADLAPRIFGHTHLEPSNGISNPIELNAFAPGELCNRA
jgi:hypothetical protein